MQMSLVRQVEIEMNRLQAAIAALKQADPRKDDSQETLRYRGGKERAAVLRASLDLTNAMAKMRNTFAG